MWKLRVVRERSEPYSMRKRFTSSTELYAGFRDYFAMLDREEFVVLCLDNKHQLEGFHVVSVGSVSASIVHPREVFKVALLCNASALVFMHNHPAGDPTPSKEDIEITKRLRECADIFGIRVLDHVVFGDGRFVSFVDDGYW